MEYNTIKVHVLEGRNLKAADRNWQGKKTSSDPYVKIRVEGHPGTFKTKTIYKNLNPVWNETIDIAWPVNKALEDVSLEIFDKDIASKDDSLGGLVIAAADIIHRADCQTAGDLLVEMHKKWVPVSGGGGGELLVCAILFSSGNGAAITNLPPAYNPAYNPESEIEMQPADGMPIQFHVKDKWPYLANAEVQPVLPNNEAPTAAQIQRVFAYKCINYRGAIANGKRNECAFR